MLELVLARIFALLLAIGMVTGTATRAYASLDGAFDVPSEIDDAVDAAVLPRVAEPIPVAVPQRPQPICSSAPGSPIGGRMHAVLIFRPPRLLASRSSF
jgi:hypothetical protein